ncbi:hypothetical protein QQ045_018770 [Rhodiola kirilowii]
MKMIKCRRRLKLNRRRKPKRKSIIHYLPEDVLYEIFTRLDKIDLKSISLVCKFFRSLSGSLVTKLFLNDSSLNFRKLFKRFSCVKTIVFDDISELDNALLAISKSDLNLEKLQLPLFEYGMNAQYPERHTIKNMSKSSVIKGIKSLDVNWFDGAVPRQVIEFINLFPSIIELNITCGYRWKDKLIHKVTSKLPNLRKISLCYSKVATDKILAILSTNCPKLESFKFQKWEFTPEAMYKFFWNNPKMSSVYMSPVLPGRAGSRRTLVIDNSFS